MDVNDGCCPGDAAPSAPLRQPPHDQDDNSRDSRERGYVRSQRQNGRSRPNGRGTRSYFREAATDQYHGIAERAEKRLVVKPPIAVTVTGACGKCERDYGEACPKEGAGGGGGENGVEDPEICKLRAGTRPKKEVLRKMCTALAIATAFMVFQFVGGYITGSIAIMTDAVHELSDAFNYVIAIAATILSVRAAKRNYSFGYHRAEIIGALINVVSICVLAGMLVMQAVERLIEPEPVEGRLMFIFACTGLAVNLALLFTIGSHCPQCQNNGGGCGDVGMSLMPGGGVGCDDKGCEDKVCEDNDPVAKVLADAHCIKDGGKSNSSSGSPRNGSCLPRISATPASPRSDRSREYIGNFRTNAYGDAVDNANAVLAAAASHAGSEFSQHRPYRHQRDWDQHSVVSDYQSVSLLGPASTIYSEASRRGGAGAPAPPMAVPERVSRVSQYTERRADRYGEGYAALTRALHKVTDGLRSPTQSSRTNQDNLRQRSNTLARHGAATEATSGVHAATVGSTQRPATRQSRTRSSNAHTGRSRGRGVGEGVTIIDIESMSKYSEDYMSSSGDLDVVVACPELQVPIIEEAVNRVSYTKRTQVKLVASAVAEGWTAASRMGAGVSHNGGGYYAEEGEQTVHGGMESRYAPKIELQGSDNGVQMQQAAPAAYVSAPASTNGPARAPGQPQTPDSTRVAAPAPSYNPAPPAAPVSTSSHNSGRLPAQYMQPARAEAYRKHPSTNPSASSSIRKHIVTERDAQPIEHPPPQSYSAVSANTADGVVAHVSTKSSMPPAPQSVQVAEEAPYTNIDMLHVGSGDRGSSHAVKQAQMPAPSECGEESGAGACCKATPSTASRTADVVAPPASENYAQDVAQSISNQEPPKQHRCESMKKPHSSVSAISEDSAASEQQYHDYQQSAPASSVPSQVTAREPELYEDSVMSRYGGELDDVDVGVMGVPVAESSAQPTGIIQTHEVNRMRGSKGDSCCKSDKPPPRATAEHLARYGPSTGTRSDYEGAGSLPSMDSSIAHRNVLHARDGSQVQSHRIYSKKADKVDYAAHVQDLLKLTESELSDEYSDNPSRNSSKKASRKQKKECTKGTGCKDKGCDDPAPGGDDNDDAASSDDGMYIGNGGKNSSLRGIELHLIADVLQQVGLTIAGSILWWKDNDPDWLWVDPCCTFFFGFLVILMTKDLLITSVRDLMEATPPRIDLDMLTRKLEKIKDVVGLHDLHVWAISNDKVLMTAHIKVLPQSDRTTVNTAAERVAQRFGITHCTVQQVVVE